MTAPMLAAVLHALTAAVADGQTYVEYASSNAYESIHGGYHHGGKHLDHCDGGGDNVSGLEACKDWCSQDCECHCFWVYEDNGACQRRHSCDHTKFDTGNAKFTVYVKEDHTDNCSMFEDLGYHTTCQGTGLQSSTAANVGSLEQCKSLCVMLSFECKGIQYKSNCQNKALDECKIFTSDIDSGSPTAPEAADINTHCLKYDGPVGNSGNSLLVPVSMTMTGIDGAALLADQQAVNAVGTAIKGTVANQSASIEPEDVTVELRAGSLVADIQVHADSTDAFVNIQETLRSADLQSLVAGALGNLTDIQSFLDSNTPLEVGALEFGAASLVTATETATVTVTTPNETTTTPTTALVVSQCSGFDLRLPVLGALLMRFIIA